MKLDKAIERLEKAYQDGTIHWTIEDEAAVKLGIEALNHIKDIRQRLPNYNYSLLPGENED